jgi:hypothetical protein
MEIRLSAEQREQASKLYEEWRETIEITARAAKQKWCAAVDFQDLLSEGFLCLLSVTGLSTTPGRYDPDHPGGQRGPAQFRTYFITSLRNWYRDVGAKHASKTRNLSFIDDYDKLPQQPIAATEIEREDHLPYLQLRKTLSPLAKVVLDLRWASQPERIPLTKVAKLLKAKYDVVLVANQEIKQKLTTNTYNALNEKGIEDDCFGLLCDLRTADCRGCVDQELCGMVFSTSRRTLPPDEDLPRTPHGVSIMTDESKSPETAAEGGVATKERKARKTQLDVAFERLQAGPASRDELAEAISANFPNNKGSRAYDLIVALRGKGFLEELEKTKEKQTVTNPETGTIEEKEVTVKRVRLKADAIDNMKAQGLLQEKEGFLHVVV